MLPSTKITNLTLTNSVSAYTIVSAQDRIVLDNIQLYNNSIYRGEWGNPMFTFSLGNIGLFQNIQASGNVGSLLFCSNILQKEVYNWNITNHSSWKDVPSTYQNILILSSPNTAAEMLLNTTQATDTKVQNISVNV